MNTLNRYMKQYGWKLLQDFGKGLLSDLRKAALVTFFVVTTLAIGVFSPLAGFAFFILWVAVAIFGKRK